MFSFYNQVVHQEFPNVFKAHIIHADLSKQREHQHLHLQKRYDLNEGRQFQVSVEIEDVVIPGKIVEEPSLVVLG